MALSSLALILFAFPGCSNSESSDTPPAGGTPKEGAAGGAGSTGSAPVGTLQADKGPAGGPGKMGQGLPTK